MKFKEFYQSDYLSFHFSDIHVVIKEMPLSLHERVMLDPKLINIINASLKFFADKATDIFQKPQRPDKPTETLKKFKVKLRYPRTARGKKLGHYLPDVLYIFAEDAKEAQTKAIQFLRSKLEPIENDEQRRYPKNNYLKDIDKKHLDVKVSQVRKWEDFVQMLGDVSKKRAEVYEYFDERDLQMILKHASRNNFEKELSKLDAAQIKMLKKVYFVLAQDPYLSQETLDLLDDEVGRKIKKIKPPEVTRQPGDDEAEKEWPYWSIFEPKTQEEENELISNLSTVKDVKNAAAKFGIPGRDLHGFVGMELEIDREKHQHQVRLYDHVWDEINKYTWDKVNKKKRSGKSMKKIFADGDDYNSKEVQNLGIPWDEIVQSLMLSNEYEAFPFHDRDNADETLSTDEAADWLWNFIQQKPKRRPMVQYYQEALHKLLGERYHIKNKPLKPGNKTRIDDVPF